jgi:hypothetical protein
LKGIQLSGVLTGVAILIVSFGAASLRFQIVIKNDKWSSKFSAWPTRRRLQTVDLQNCLRETGHLLNQIDIGHGHDHFIKVTRADGSGMSCAVTLLT